MKSGNALVKLIAGFVTILALSACTTTKNNDVFKPNSEKIKSVDTNGIYGEIDGSTAEANPWASQDSKYPSWVPPTSNALPVEGESVFSSKSPSYQKGRPIQRASAKAAKSSKPVKKIR